VILYVTIATHEHSPSLVLNDLYAKYCLVSYVRWTEFDYVIKLACFILFSGAYIFVNVIINLNMWLYMKSVYIYMKSVFFCKCQKFTKIGVFPLLNSLMSDGLIKSSDIESYYVQRLSSGPLDIRAVGPTKDRYVRYRS
jgi:hypothetical protein